MKYPFIPLLVFGLFISAGSTLVFAKHYKSAPEATSIETAPETGVDANSTNDQEKRPPARPVTEEPTNTMAEPPKYEPEKTGANSSETKKATAPKDADGVVGKASDEATRANVAAEKSPVATTPNPDSLDAKNSETKTPDTTTPDATKPDTAKPDTAKPNTTKPDATKPDAAKPDAAAIKPTAAEKAQPAAPKAKAPRKAKKAKEQKLERPLTLEEMVANPGTYKSPELNTDQQPNPLPAPTSRTAPAGKAPATSPATPPKDQSRAPDASQKRSARHIQLHDYNTSLDKTGVMKSPIGDTSVSRASSARQNKRIEESIRLRNQPDHLIKDRRAYEDSFKSIHDRQASPSYWEDKRNVRTGRP